MGWKASAALQFSTKLKDIKRLKKLNEEFENFVKVGTDKRYVHQLNTGYQLVYVMCCCCCCYCVFVVVIGLLLFLLLLLLLLLLVYIQYMLSDCRQYDYCPLLDNGLLNSQRRRRLIEY